MTSPFKGQTGLKRILNASGYSLDGLIAAFTGEAAFRQLVLLNVILIPVSFLFLVSAVSSSAITYRCLPAWH
jgi:diacylglycerol kinase (ATP)